MKISDCMKCKHYQRKTWGSVFKPANYHNIGVTHAFGYCNKHQMRCLDIKKCSEDKE